jgi:predicted membrane protein
MGIEIRVFLVIDAFSRFSGTLIACSAGLLLQLAKQLLDSTAAAPGRSCAYVGAGVTAGPWRRLGKAPLTPRITRFIVPANKGVRQLA